MRQMLLYKGCDIDEAYNIMSENYPDVSIWYSYASYGLLARDCIVRTFIMVDDVDTGCNFYTFRKSDLEERIILSSIISKDLMLKEIESRRFIDEVF